MTDGNHCLCHEKLTSYVSLHPEDAEYARKIYNHTLCYTRPQILAAARRALLQWKTGDHFRRRYTKGKLYINLISLEKKFGSEHWIYMEL